MTLALAMSREQANPSVFRIEIHRLRTLKFIHMSQYTMIVAHGWCAYVHY